MSAWRAVAARARDMSPTQVVVLGFLAVIGLGALALWAPVSHAEDVDHTFGDALFTSVSATTVTGLQVVDPATSWSGFGQVVLLVLMQLGGLGLMTVSSMIAIALAGRLGLRRRLALQAEAGAGDLGQLRRVLVGVFRWSLAIEAVVALGLFARLATEPGTAVGQAVWQAVFHAVSAFNNAGFALYPDNLVRFAEDPLVTAIISVGIIAGGVGFPVLDELQRGAPPRRWSVHTKVTLLATAGLLAFGAVAVTALEWSNPDTLGPLGLVDKLANGWFQGVTPRTAGFNTVDTGAMNESTLLVTITLMFIGAASGSTGGGIKVTTFAVLAYAIWAEVRGRRDAEAFGRRIPEQTLRQALTVALIGVAVVVAGTIALTATDDLGLRDALFEAASAFGTAGLSTGVTPGLGPAGRVVIGVMMFIGRVGPITLVAALVMREGKQRYRYPEERPLVG